MPKAPKYAVSTPQTTAKTVFALSSGTGRSAIAVIRISGPGTESALRGMAGAPPEPRRAALRTLRMPESDDPIDRALVLWFPAPASFTGEDMAEFHVHGGRAVVEACLSALSEMANFELAEPGAFARRAFENGKLDLTEVEGLADLINAQTEGQRRQALRQTQGALRDLYENWRGRLLRAMALTEAALDFSDEVDVAEDALAQARNQIRELAPTIAAHLDDGHRGEILRDGLQVVIAGPPNAGKSSLLNALSRRDAAIVSDEPGTTRDVVEVCLDLSGFAVSVLDTAGIRESEGKIEREGMRRSVARAADADLILWITDAAAEKGPLPQSFEAHREKVWRVANKLDLLEFEIPTEDAPFDHSVSAKTGAGLESLLRAITVHAERMSGDHSAPAITRARHRQELTRCVAALDRFLTQDLEQSELRAEDLRAAAQSLGRITGRVDVEDILGQIFSEFCIGK